MFTENREVRPCAKPRHVVSADGRVMAVPSDWALLPPGDAALSRRIKQDGPSWTVVEKKGRKRFSHGIWAPSERIVALREERDQELRDPAYQRRLNAGRQRREVEQAEYAEEFRGAVLTFLNFHSAHCEVAELMARLVTDHAVPVGSGTVARTARIPIEQRAEAAVIAWMRHQTTAYDQMVIPLVKGRRREVRRMLAQRSLQVLARYRHRGAVDVKGCPLARALAPHRTKLPVSIASGHTSVQLGLTF